MARLVRMGRYDGWRRGTNDRSACVQWMLTHAELRVRRGAESELGFGPVPGGNRMGARRRALSAHFAVGP